MPRNDAFRGPQVNNPGVHPDAPAGGGGPGLFRIPRQPGPLGRELLAQSGPGIPVAKQVTPVSAVSSKEILRDVKNVDRTDDKPFDNAFDWLTPFKVGGTIVLIPEKPSPNIETLRRKMLQALGNSRLAQNVLRLAKETEQERRERAAWILENGELGPIQKGSLQKVEAAPMPQRNVVGFVHTHPTTPFELAPPSPGALDYDSSLRDNPIQFVAESAKGRVWAQYLPTHTSLLGRIIGPAGSFQPLSADDPLAKTIYKVISTDTWKKMEEEKAKKEREKERERLKQRLLDEQKVKQKYQ
jgi:hypothetical protein